MVEFGLFWGKDLQLDATEEGAKKTHHAQEFDPTQVLHNKLLTNIGNSIKRRPRKDQEIT